MQNKSPLVSVVTPTYNRKKLAERLIRSVFASTYKNIEHIVVDDASPDGTYQYLRLKFGKDKRVKIFRNKKNLFAAGTKNVGQGKAKGDFILFADDDNFLDRRMIESLVKTFVQNPKIGEVGPINYNFNKKNIVLMSRSTRNMFTTKTLHLRTLAPFKGKDYWPTDDVPNSFMVRGDIVRKNKIKFKPEYGIMYEESDYAYRVRKAGYEIVMVRDAKVYHDIEDPRAKTKKDYLFHFMSDRRRPFVFARNRILFHSVYSNAFQKLFIYIFWAWFFTAYYVYKFLFYNGFGKFSLEEKMLTSFAYFMGTINGLYLIFRKNVKN